MSATSETATSSRRAPSALESPCGGGLADLPGMLAAHGVVRTFLLWVGLCLVAAAAGQAKYRVFGALWPSVVLGFGSTLWQLSWQMLGRELARLSG